MQTPQQIALVRLLLARLERISVDSYWSHRASGLRGSRLRGLDSNEGGQTIDESRLQNMIDAGFVILELAALENRRVS